MASTQPVRISKARLGLGNFIALAIADFAEGIEKRELWIFLGWREIKKLYQRSMIGPFWLTINMGLLIGGLGFLYAQIFKQDVSTYLPYLATGIILWTLIGTILSESCTVFINAASTIKQLRLPFSMHIFQFLWRHLIIFAHNFTIYIVIAIAFGIWPGINGLLFIPALLILVLNGAFSVMLLGLLSARYRDIPLIIASVMQIFFFMTPIFWSPTALPERAIILTFNPFYHLLEIARQPLLGEVASAQNWTVSLVLTAVVGIVAFLFYSRFRIRIPYWA